MAMPLATAFVLIRPDGTGFGTSLKRQLGEAGKVAEAEGGKTGSSWAQGFQKSKIVHISNLITEGLAGAAAESVMLGVKFQATMERLHTQAGVAQDKIAGLGQGVLKLAGQVGLEPDSLAESLYHVESNFASLGISGPKALALVKIAAQGAQIGGADLVDVTNAITAAVASGIPGVQNFGQAMGTLNAIVGAGDMHMQDLAEAFGSGMVATVKGFGLSLQDVGAVLDVFGDNNIRGAHAGTQLRMSVMALAAPTKAGAASLVAMGISSGSLAKAMANHGLLYALDLLMAKMRGSGITAKTQGEFITNAFGKKAGAGLNVLLDQMDRLRSKYPALSKGAHGFGSAWAATQKTASVQMKELGASVVSLATAFGLKLLPYVEDVLNFIRGHLSVVVKFAVVVAGVALAISAVSTALKLYAIAEGVYMAVTKGAALVTAAFNDACIGTRIGLMAMAVASKVAAAGQWLLNVALDANPIGLVVVAIGALVVGFVELYKHCGWFREVVKDTFGWIKDHWKLLLVILTGPIGYAVLVIIKHWKAVRGAFEDLWHYVWTDFGAKIAGFFIHTLPGWLTAAVSWTDRNFIQPQMQLFRQLYQWIWTDFGAKISHFLLTTLPGWFTSAVHAIGTAWHAVEGVAKIPVNWLIQYVYDDGIRKLWNFVANIAGLPDLPVVQTLAAGGRIPGFGGGDRHAALLEGGEAVIDKNRTQLLAPLFGAMGVPGFAQGGLIGDKGMTGTPHASFLGGLLNGIFGAGKIMAALASGNKVALEHAFEGMFPPAGASGARSGSGLLSLITQLPVVIVTDLVKKAMAAFGAGGNAIVHYAESFLGKVPYVWGGNTPSGWDCSGMTSYVYDKFGYTSIPRTAAAQQSWAQKTGSPVPGGLAFFAGSDGTAKSAGHVGIIIDATKMVNAYGTGFGTIISPLLGSSGSSGGFGIPPGGFGHHDANVNVHDKGGWLPPGLSLSYNGTGRPERVLGPGDDLGGRLDDLISLTATMVGILSAAPGEHAAALGGTLGGSARRAGYRAMYSPR